MIGWKGTNKSSARITNIITLLLGILHAKVQQSYVVISMLNQIFYLLAVMLGFFIFWLVIQKLLERMAENKPSREFAPVALVHWIILGVLSVISIAECAMYIAFMVKGVDGSAGYARLVFDYNKLSSGLSILCWVASMEILCWVIFAFARIEQKVFSPHSTIIYILCKLTTQAGLTPLTIGTFFFFTINLVMAILQIHYVLRQNLPPDHLNATRSIIEFVCTVGIYTNLLLCFRKWHHVHISPPQMLIQEPEMGENLHSLSHSHSHSGSGSRASSIRSYHNTVYSQQQQQLHYAVPQGAASVQQVHMWVPR